MAVARRLLLVAVLLFISSGLHCSSPLPACPESCSCQRAPLLNCSSSGLFLVPKHIQDCVTDLDLSHNLLNSVTLLRPHRNLRNIWLGNNTITHLSLCIERNLGTQYVRDRRLRRSRPWIRECVSWAPTLQLLSVERNQLQQLPEGLQGSEFLQVLQLSFNRISSLRPGDLRDLQQLKELHLQHNLITSLHPQMFQDLAQLRVLDLSFNMLTSLHPLMYLSLRNIGADVRLYGNRWQCDCSMRSLRRRMAYDNSRGLQTWTVLCASPSIFSGKDLLQLEEDDLNCLSTDSMQVLHRDVTVYSGSEILLSCSTQDSVWWTPSSQASLSQTQTGLLINDITERDAGLYVCVSEDHRVLSVFNLQISKIKGTRRNTRSLPRSTQQIIPRDSLNRVGQQRNQAQSNLTLAVCLSVFITFLVAFILGVLARPCIDVLCKRLTKKKRSSATNSGTPAEQQQQYDNEAFSSGEEPGEIPTHRERRVTFSTVDFREDINVQYYDAVAGGSQESINDEAVFVCEVAVEDKRAAGVSGSKNTLRQSTPENKQKNHNMEFEHIPDPDELEETRSLSSRSDSSLSDKVIEEDQMTQGDSTIPKYSQLAKDSVQQRPDFSTATKVEVPHISIEGTSEIHRFPSEPFADWSPHTNDIISTDLDDHPWQENEEQFEFSDSVRSTSARSSIVLGSFTDAAPTSDNQKKDDMSSSSSYVSEDEPTHYTVNSDREEEENIERNHKNVDNRYGAQRPPLRPEHSLSSDSSDSDDEPMQSKVKQGTDKEEGKEKYISENDKPSSRIVPVESGIRDKAPSLGSNSSSSSDSEDETTFHTEKPTKTVIGGLPLEKSPTVSPNSITQLPAVNLEEIPRIKRRLDIKAQSLGSDSSSSSDSENETIYHTEIPGKVDIVERPLQNPHQRWPVLDPNPNAPSTASESSSSSDSEDEAGHTKTQRPGKVDIAGIQESPTLSHNSKVHFPVLDLEHIPHIKRRLDIKARSPAPDSSSSSDSEDETTDHTEKQRPVKVEIPYRQSEAESHDLKTSWPTLDLEHTTSIKRRLDIKAPSLASDSSSSSDSEDEATNCIKKKEQGETHMGRLPVEISQTVRHEPETRWPALDLEHTTSIKRRLDIKGPSPASDSSSSSDSEDDVTDLTEKHRPAKPDIAELPLNDPDTRWPALDFDRLPRIKRRLDIKVLSPHPYSSPNIEIKEDKISKIKNYDEVHVTKPPYQQSEGESYDLKTSWPALDLEHTTSIKRRLDIKAPSLASDSSSSSDSEDEATNYIKKQEHRETDTTRFPIEISQTVRHEPETRWPALDLEHTTSIKRRLDIKGPSPASDSPSDSSSDSEDEITDHTEKHRPAKPDFAELPLNDPDTRWPALDFDRLPRIKRRLDIKVLSPHPYSSPTIEIKEDKISKIKKYEEVHMTKPPYKKSEGESYDLKTSWPALDLEHTTSIKRRLDIKGPSPASDSSSSSDSEDEITPAKPDIAKLPLNDPDTRWPALDFDRLPRIKRRLDIKALSPHLYSSPNIEIKEDKISKIKNYGEVHVTKPDLNQSEGESYDLKTSWPTLDLEHTTSIKRRLDIKGPSLASDSSSSSDSEDEATNYIKKQEHGETDTTRWPALNLEHTTSIKRRLDIKGPSPASELPSDSSSDSDDEITDHTEKQMSPVKLDIAKMPPNDPDAMWPTLELQRIPHIKRRLDIKALSHPPDSSSNSEMVEEKLTQIKKHEQEAVQITKLPFQKSEADRHDPETKWSVLDLKATTSIKRRLDIKAPSQDLDSSSSSDSEDETTQHIGRLEKMNTVELPLQNSQNISHDPETQWPTVDLVNITRTKRRLDIKALSQPHDSLLSGEITGHTVEGQRTDVNKISPYQSSSCSDEEEGMENLSKPPVKVMSDPDPRWPELDLISANRLKRRLDIKVLKPPFGSSFNSDSDIGTTDLKVESDRSDHKDVGITKNEQQTSDKLKLVTPHINRRLDIKATSPRSDLGVSSVSVGSQQSGSNSSSSESEDEKTNLSATIGIQVPAVSKASEKEFIRSSKTPLISNSSSPKSDHNIKLEKYTLITDNSLSVPTNDNSNTTPEINPELQSRWATMNLGISRFRKRLDITSSPSSFSSENEGKRGRATSRLPVVTDKQASENRNSQSKIQEVERKDGVELKSETSGVAVESDSMLPQLSLTNIPVVKRALDIRAPLQTESSSSSNSDDETTHHSVPDLSLGFSRIKRRLNIKAPAPEQSDSPSSHSEGENEVKIDTAKESRYASNMSGMTENEPIITYRRLIMKAPSLPSNYLTSSSRSETTHHAEMVTDAQDGPSHIVGDRNESLYPRRVQSISFGDVVKKRTDQSRSTTDVDFPPEIRWTGINRHFSDLTGSGSRRQLDVDLESPQQPPASTNFDNSTSVTKENMRIFSDERREKKGLSALKIMSTERQKWDTDNKALDRASTLSDNHGPHDETSVNLHRSKEDIESLAKEPLSQFHRSSTREGRAADLLYGIPRYRRHDTGDTEPPQDAPPPVPATPPPDEAVELTWRSPQRNKLTRTMEESSSLTAQNLALYFDSSNMNITDV